MISIELNKKPGFRRQIGKNEQVQIKGNFLK